MIAMLLSEKEIKEMQYLLQREMDEILYDLRDDRIDYRIKEEIAERYQHLFTLFKRVAPSGECMKYVLAHQKSLKKVINQHKNRRTTKA